MQTRCVLREKTAGSDGVACAVPANQSPAHREPCLRGSSCLWRSPPRARPGIEVPTSGIAGPECEGALAIRSVGRGGGDDPPPSALTTARRLKCVSARARCTGLGTILWSAGTRVQVQYQVTLVYGFLYMILLLVQLDVRDSFACRAGYTWQFLRVQN